MPSLRLLSTLAQALALVIVASCGTPEPLPSTPNASADGLPMLSIETRGGECPSGPCGSLITIGQDGSVHQVRPSGQDLGPIPAAELDALTAEIERANFPLIESRPFTGECPTAFDGQETLYTFHLPSGDEMIATCKVAVDPNHPLFLAVGAAMRTFISEAP
jgi:hypothetical protein